MSPQPVIAVSGGFDPLHVGHVRLIDEASAYGRVLVLLNSDAWLLRKKGYAFMPWGERAEVLLALGQVWMVREVDDEDGTVCEGLRRYRPVYFANGGDRDSPDALERRVCDELGIKELFSIGGGKVQSSSELVRAVAPEVVP